MDYKSIQPIGGRGGWYTRKFDLQNNGTNVET